jgi:hypothetical protein
MLARAIENLRRRYTCFGLQEHYEESLGRLQAELGLFNRAEVGLEKRTRRRPTLSEVDRDTRSALEDANRLDCRLYDAAVKMFETQSPGLAVPPR